MTILSDDDVRRIRMAALLVHAGPAGLTAPSSVSDVVTRLGAMQAQDYASGLWSLGLRLPGTTQADVVDALEQRQALRTWPMRGTVHLVPARDARWMVAATGARALHSAAGRRVTLGLDDDVVKRAMDVIGDELTGRRMTRSLLLEALAAHGIPVSGQSGYHLLVFASQGGLIAIAPDVDGEQTFVLLDEWVTNPVTLEGDQALATLAVRYFGSHGPTTVKDFSGWTGLTLTDSRRAVAAAGDALATAEHAGVPVHLDPQLLDARATLSVDDDVHALPGFDEYLLGYKDRSLMLTPGDFEAVVPGGNGIFRSTFVRGGRVLGTWTRATKGKKAVVTAIPLRPLGSRDRHAVEESFLPWATFVGVALEVRWHDGG
ncbi:MAG: winged helix DNA-binding domain-containing protein [Actinomycetes bacterium]